MLPVIAIVGRPNVGKSALFNCLTKTKEALVVDFPGTTRDRIYGEGKIGKHPYVLIDTGGLGLEEDNVDQLMVEQSWQAVDESDLILFVVDAKTGLHTNDELIADKLRRMQKKVTVVVNKIDGLNIDTSIVEFFRLGFNLIKATSATHNIGIKSLADAFLENFNYKKDQEIVDLNENESENWSENENEINLDEVGINEEKLLSPNFQKFTKNLGIKFAVIGKPNVGKSTLVNKIIGDERVIVFDSPGTTRDSIYIPFEKNNEKYTIIDTAGVRKKAKVKKVVEKFSIVKTLKAVEDSHVVILVISAKEGITDQDLSLLEFIINAGKAVIIAINKWDQLNFEEKNQVKKTLSYRLRFADFTVKHFISALRGIGVKSLINSVRDVYKSVTKKHSTAKLTKILQSLVERNSPPVINGRRIKLRYAHIGGYNPPKIIIHGNQTEKIPKNYERYLSNSYRELLKVRGSIVKVVFRTSDNPFKDRTNKLNVRQIKKRQRLIKHRKKRDKK